MIRRLLAALTLAAAVLTMPSAAPADPGPLRILAIGDSITADGRWQAKLDELLDAAGVPHVIETEAVGGTRCWYWAARIAALLAAHHPDLVILACGTNDDPNELAYGEPASGWAVRTVYEAVHASGARTLPVLIGYSDPLVAPDWLLHNEPITNDTIYRQIVRYPASWLAGVADWELLGATPTYLDAGGIHPTARGYGYLGRIAYDAAAPAMGWPPVVVEPPPCDLFGHRRGYPRPAYIRCPEV